MRKISALLASLFCILILIPFDLQADSLSGKNNLTLHYATNDGLPLSNAVFYLYRIAERNDNGEYALIDEFVNYKVDLSEFDCNEAGRLTMLAITLSAYVERDNVSYLQTNSTDAKGNLTFENLEDGLYMVCGDVLPVNIDDVEWNFKPQPLLIPLPYPDIDSSITDMEVDVKYDCFPQSLVNETRDLTVRKNWKNSDEHPDSITVQLICSKSIIDSIQLNEYNNWQYTWKNLNAGYFWQITEETVPEGYTVAVHRESYVFTIINTEYDVKSATGTHTQPPEKTQPTTEELTHSTTKSTPDVDNPTKSNTENPPYTDNPNNTPNTPSDTPKESPDISSSKLPQTGQLWWPVPLLAGNGLIMIGTGLILRCQKKD